MKDTDYNKIQEIRENARKNRVTYQDLPRKTKKGLKKAYQVNRAPACKLKDISILEIGRCDMRCHRPKFKGYQVLEAKSKLFLFDMADQLRLLDFMIKNKHHDNKPIKAILLSKIIFSESLIKKWSRSRWHKTIETTMTFIFLDRMRNDKLIRSRFETIDNHTLYLGEYYTREGLEFFNEPMKQNENENSKEPIFVSKQIREMDKNSKYIFL